MSTVTWLGEIWTQRHTERKIMSKNTEKMAKERGQE
jgi:hypothetical protein